MPSRRTPGRYYNDSGTTLYLVAAGMVFILATCGLAVDLVSLYTARSEAQRAADAAALAGATMFVSSGCTSNASCTNSTVETAAISQAEAVGNTNFVGGQSPGITDADVLFSNDAASGGNPRITVNAHQTIPTFFIKIFGVSNVPVSATATAEAYNPSGAGAAPPQTICEGCVKPAIVPNCDPNPKYAAPTTNCPPPSTYFIDLTTHAVENPGVFPNGPIGEEWTVSSVVPTPCGPPNPCVPYYELDFGGFAPQYPTNVSSCYSLLIGKSGLFMTCGDQFNTLAVANVGASAGSWETLIHQGTSSDCTGPPPISGQDTIVINGANALPYVISGGSANPNPALQGVAGISSSDSIVTVPMYDGASVPSGQPATIVGFMQLFVEYACHNTTTGSDDVTSRILNVTGCASKPGGCGIGSTGTVSGGGASTIPVRLVQPG
jgi:hypothetical protein